MKKIVINFILAFQLSRTKQKKLMAITITYRKKQQQQKGFRFNPC